MSGPLSTFDDVLRTNLILFDYGQVLGTQIEDVFVATTEALLEASRLSRHSLRSKGLWSDFENGLRMLVIPPGSLSRADDAFQQLPKGVRLIGRLDLHRDSALFGEWVRHINAYLTAYGAARPVSRAQFEEAYFGPLRPNPWIQERLNDLLRLRTVLDVRFGVISNFEAAGRPWMLRLLREHYPRLIDDGLVVITGEEGVVKSDGPEIFSRALDRFRRCYGEPVSPVFVDNQVDRYVAHAREAGIHAFVHYGFASADSKRAGGFYGGEFECATLYPCVDDRAVFRTLFQKAVRKLSRGVCG